MKLSHIITVFLFVFFILGGSASVQASSPLSLRLSPPVLFFPNTDVGQSSPTQKLTVTAVRTFEGGLECDNPYTCHGVNIFAVIPINSSNYKIVNDTCTGRTLSLFQSCNITLNFSPQQSGRHIGSVVILSDSIEGLDFALLFGTAVAPSVKLSTHALHFGDQTVGKSSSQSVRMTNSGKGNLNISNITISGSTVFTQTNNCPSTLAPTFSCIIQVTFTPTSADPFSGTLNLFNNASDSPQTVSLDGTGVTPPVPDITLDPAYLIFPLQEVGSTSTAQVVTVTNIGDANLDMTSVTGDAIFNVINDLCSGQTLVPNATCTFGVTFSPNASGFISSNIILTNNATDSPQSLPVSGTGFLPGPPVLTLSTTNVNFGTIDVGSTSGTEDVTLQNTGGSDLIITNIELAGLGAYAFSDLNDCHQATLAPGESCLFVLSFSPLQNGIITASLVITSNANSSMSLNTDENSQAAVALAGIGVTTPPPPPPPPPTNGSGGGCNLASQQNSYFTKIGLESWLLMLIVLMGFQKIKARHKIR